MAQAKIYKNLIGGEWVESRTGKTFENLNPADTRDLVGIFQASSKQDVDDAEVINSVEVLVRLVRRAYPALVLVEQEVLPLAAGIFVRQYVGAVESLRIGLAHDATHGRHVGRVRALTPADYGFPPDQLHFGLSSTSAEL